MAMPAAFDLSGRVAVVTGAGSPDGIGFACAGLLAELGAAVMIGGTTGRIEARAGELRAADFDAAGFTGDLTSEETASGLVSATLERWGRLDVVVNNAGMTSAASPVFESGTAETMDLATWQAALARNLTSAFLVTKAALPAMTAHGWGRVVMVASLTGPVMAIRADVGYAAAKAGMTGLTRGSRWTWPGRESPSTPWPRAGSRPGRSSRPNAARARPPRRAGAARPARSPPPSPGWPAPARPTSPASAWWWTAATPSPSSAPHPGIPEPTLTLIRIRPNGLAPRRG